MRQNKLFLLFIIYSIIPIVFSTLLVLSKTTGAFIIKSVQGQDLFSILFQLGMIIIPWVLFLMNTHIYLYKKIEGLDLYRMFIGIILLQGVLSLIALISMLALTFF